jgi:hypothetical protein
MTTKRFTLYSRLEYFTRLIEMVSKARTGDRVAVAAMVMDSPEPLVAQLIDTLCMAAGRGAHVSLSIDAYSFLGRKGSIFPGPLWYHTKIPSELPEPYRQFMYDLEKLRVNGGHYGISNIPSRPFSIIVKGRSHIKGAVVNNYTFIGGCNLEEPQQTDIMVELEDRKLADWFYGHLTALTQTQSTLKAFHGQDQTLQLDDVTTAIIDAGVRGQSAIYEHALQLIDEAKEWILITCQYFPGGETATHLYAAYKRGVAVRIIFSHPHAHRQKAFMHYAYNWLEQLQLPAEFFVDRRPKDAQLLHAKILATEQGVMVGSHNYVEQGVRFGTAEVALHIKDSKLPKQAIDVVTKQL